MLMNNLKNITGVSPDLFTDRLQEIPDWLWENKKNAWSVFTNLTASLGRKEKFNEVIESLELERISAESAFSLPENDSVAVWGEISGNYVFGSVEPSLDPVLAQKGVIFKSLKKALTENEELVRPYLTKSRLTSRDSRFTALAEAMWTDGVLLYVPANLDVSLPLHLLKQINQGNSQNYYKTLVIVDSGSNLSLLDEYESVQNSADFFLVSGINELHIKDNAKVTYTHLQNFSENAFNFSLQKMFLGSGATLKSLTVSMGSQFSYENIRTYQEKSHSSAELLGLVLGESEQVFQHETLQYHPAAAAHSDLHFEIMVKDRSESSFNGFVEIEKAAIQTDAHQLCRNLILNRNAKAEAVPNLEILADDVKCSHGVTIGPVNPEEIFYLMARGFSQSEAENLLIEGNVENVVKAIESEELSEKIRDYVLNNLKRRGNA